ncbi:MAG: DNRLRE domain-containing protein [Lachnospiraceae bacterium]|nr:DNRLRE domain-containing protein [Lachnospiraceae bacterium]
MKGTMRKMKSKVKISIAVVAAAVMIVTGLSWPTSPENTGAAEKAVEITHGEAKVRSELTAKRTKFTKQYAMSDGSFLANSYSMPVHYKKGGKWKEINTTLVKTKNKKNCKTKSTSLGITVARKANKKAEITLKRGSDKLSIALQGKEVKAKKAKISNPKKKESIDILNSNQVQYKKAYKNQTLTYEIYPEKLVEKISVKKKSAAKKITLKLGSKLTVKSKKNRIYFKTKKGKTKYKRLKTVITDSKNVSTSKVKVTYNRKKKTITLKPNKKWLKSKKRSFPVTVRTAYTTDRHERDVKIGAAYAGSPKSNFTYNESLLLQANKCVAFTRMSNLAEFGKANVKVRNARLYVKNEKTLKMGAGKTFDVGVHKVTTKWKGKKVTNNKRPTYASTKSATISMQKKGTYSCDVTNIVKEWYQGVPNYGVALVAENSNGTYQTKIQKNPYFSVHYEVVGFEGAVQLKENQDITRDVLKSGQENYYYFDPKPGIAYELYTTSGLDTQGILYSNNKERLDYDDDSGLDENFQFVKSYHGRRYLKVNVKGKETGKYTLSLRKRFAIPVVTGLKGQDSYILNWNKIKNAKEYLVTIYGANGKIAEVLTAATTYEYVYNNETVGKILAFTVTPRENKNLVGEPSAKVYNTSSSSQWNYAKPLQQKRAKFAASVWDEKIYVLGGIDKDTGACYKDMECYHPQNKTWTKITGYPEAISGICNAGMVALNDCIYVVGGQTGTDNSAKLLKSTYAFYPGTNRWIKLADMPQGRADMPMVAYDGKIYLFAKAGTTERIDIYNPDTNQWTSEVYANTSTIIQAQVVDGHIFVLREKEDKDSIEQKVAWEEYLPESGEYDTIGKEIAVVNANRYLSGTVVNGKIYMVNDAMTKSVLCYDVYLDEWSELSDTNLEKEASQILSIDDTLYSVGGYATGFGTLDVVESLSLDSDVISKVLSAKKGQIYELQVNAGNCKEDTDYLVTLRVDPKVLQFSNASSFMQKDEIKKGKDGIQLISYSEEKGVMVIKLRGKMEAGDTYEAFQSVPVEALKDKKTVVEMQIEKK